MDIMNKLDMNEIAALAHQAGQLLLEMVSQDLEVSRKADGSMVTRADAASNQLLKEGLARITKGQIPIVTEEDYVTGDQLPEQCIVVDPLDGTRTYAKYAQGKAGRTGFGVLIGVLDKGRAVGGVACYPAEGTLYYTGNDSRAYVQRQGETKAIHVNSVLEKDQLTIACTDKPAENPESLGDYSLSKITTVAGKRLCEAAEGKEVDIAFIPKSHHTWDIMGPHAILIAAGGTLIELPEEYWRLQEDAVIKPDDKRLGADITYIPEHYDLTVPEMPPCIGGSPTVLQQLGFSNVAYLEELRQKVAGLGLEVT